MFLRRKQGVDIRQQLKIITVWKGFVSWIGEGKYRIKVVTPGKHKQCFNVFTLDVIFEIRLILKRNSQNTSIKKKILYFFS